LTYEVVQVLPDDATAFAPVFAMRDLDRVEVTLLKEGDEVTSFDVDVFFADSPRHPFSTRSLVPSEFTEALDTALWEWLPDEHPKDAARFAAEDATELAAEQASS
jgi:hypothetical protein